MRAEDDAAAGEDRRAGRAGAGAAGALLAPGLGVAAGDQAARLGRGGAAAACGELGAHRLVQQRPVEAGAEGGLVERDRARAAAEHGSVSHRCAPRRSRCAGPGTAPRTNSRFSLGAHLDDLEAALGDALVAHLAWSANALEDARGRRRGADRARRADVVGAVAGRAAAEAVALDRALEALALRDPGDLDALAGLEHADTSTVSPTARPAPSPRNSHEVAQRRRVGLRQVAELGLGQRLLANAAEARAARRRSRRARLVRIAVTWQGPAASTVTRAIAPSSPKTCVMPSLRARIAAIRGPVGSRCRRRPADGRVAGASRRSSASDGGCRSGACACGSRSARASPCP